MHTVITEAEAGFVHLYAYGVSRYTFLAGLTGRPIHNLEDLELYPTRLFQSQTLVYIAILQVSKICLRNQNRAFPLRMLMYHLQKKDYVQCPADMTHHSAEFVAAL